LQSVPSANLIISNMVGPQGQLYLGGAPMVGFQGLPIVPPGGGLNVTFASVHKDIGLAVGATAEAVSDPYQLIQFIMGGFEKLQKSVLGNQAKTKAKTRKTRSGK
jgi:diacylglycerol O-acyltransferase